MNWSEPKPPTKGESYYDFTILKTPIGEFKIEWKSWKERPSYDIDFNGEWIGSECSLEDAKKVAEKFLINKRDEFLEYFKTI